MKTDCLSLTRPTHVLQRDKDVKRTFFHVAEDLVCCVVRFIRLSSRKDRTSIVSPALDRSTLMQGGKVGRGQHCPVVFEEPVGN